MPAENYYCPDNFFKKMTDLESPKKNNDCYFYYYSTCAKGDNCIYRHEPSALGCETMCSFWKEGKCLNIHCNFRHMELRKNRKAIPCYWESQPMGCLKAHCPFLHQNEKQNDASNDRSNSVSDRSENMLNNQLNQESERKVTAVDSLVVNFEEESDNESGPTQSPKKGSNRIVTVKTLEEIKLEKVQAESAAYYSYSDEEVPNTEMVEDMRLRIFNRMIMNKSLPESERIVTLSQINRQSFPPRARPSKRLSNDELACILGDESLRKKPKIVYKNEAGNIKIMLDKSPSQSQVSVTVNNDSSQRIVKPKYSSASIDNIKVKTLAEIRAEKRAKEEVGDIKMEENEQEVTSTCVDENPVQNTKEHKNTPTRRIKLRRKLPESKDEVDSVTSAVKTSRVDSSKMDVSDGSSSNIETESVSSKVLDERLLLESDDDDDSVILKAEEDLLNEIDTYLDD